MFYCFLSRAAFSFGGINDVESMQVLIEMAMTYCWPVDSSACYGQIANSCYPVSIGPPRDEFFAIYSGFKVVRQVKVLRCEDTLSAMAICGEALRLELLHAQAEDPIRVRDHIGWRTIQFDSEQMNLVFRDNREWAISLKCLCILKHMFCYYPLLSMTFNRKWFPLLLSWF